MKTNKLKNYIKLGIILFSISLLLTNCQNDIDDRNDIQKNEIIIKRVTFEELSSKENIQNSLKSISKKLDFNKVQSANKNINSNDNSFVILTDEILETTKNSLTNYSFRIQTPTDINSEFENFVIQQKDSTHYEFYLYKYELETNSDEDFPYLISRTLINDSQINLENFSDLIKKVQKIDDCYWDISFDSSCGCEHVQLLFCTDGGSSNGTSGNGNSNGDNDNGNNETPHDDVDVNDSGMQGDNDPSDHGSGSSSSSSGNNAVGIIKKPFIPYDQQISNCLGVPMPAQNGSTNTQFNYNDWLNSPETTFLETKRVATFLNDNNCSQEAQDFILEILENILNEQTDSTYVLGIEKDTTFENSQLDCIYEKLKTQNNEDNFFKTMLKEFGGMFTNLSFEIDTTPNNSIGFTKSGTVNYGTYQVNNFIVTSSPGVDNSSNLNKMVNLSHELMHAYMFNSLESWGIIGFDVDGKPIVLNGANFCAPSSLTPNSDINTLSMQEKWEYLLCEIYLNNNNSFPNDWTHTLFNTSYFDLENYRGELEQLLLDTHDWDNEPTAIKNYMIQVFGVNDWKQKVAEYMSWTGLQATEEFNNWLVTQNNYLDPILRPTLNDLFYLAVTDWWTEYSHINDVLNNCN